MNILLVSAHLFTGLIGGESAKEIFGLAKALSRRGHTVTIYATDAFNKADKSTQWARHINEQGIDIVEFKNLHGRIAIAPALIPTMAKHSTQFDIIHLNQYPTFLNVISHHYANKYKIPYVLQAHGSLPGITSNRILRQIYDTLWGHKILKNASRVIAVSQMEVAQYKNNGIDTQSIRTIPNGIDTSEFENLPERGTFRKKHGLTENQKVILYLGRIHKVKGLALLARSFASLVKDLPNTRLVIAGPDDGYLQALKKLVISLKLESTIIFTGPVYGQDKLAVYVDADVYVLPSFYDVFGVTVLEACACGIPVIVSDCSGVADIVDNQAGLIFSRNEAQLKQSLLKMLTADKLRREYSKKGKLLVRNTYNWRKIAKQMEMVYDEIL